MPHHCTRGKLDVNREAHRRMQTMTVDRISPTCPRKLETTVRKLVLKHIVAPYHGAHRSRMDVSSALVIRSCYKDD